MKAFVLYNFPNRLLTKTVRFDSLIIPIIVLFMFFKDFTISPSVWLGTSTGSVIVVNLNIIYEPRNISGKIDRLIFEENYPRVFLVVPSGTVFRLSGRMLHISFLDQKGVLIPSPSEKWETRSTFKCALVFLLLWIDIVESKSNRVNDGIQDFNPPPVLPGSGTSSPATTSPPPSSIQYAVFCSSKEARVSSSKSALRKSFSLVRSLHYHLKYVYLNKKSTKHSVHLHQVSLVHP